ncbi:penicillin-binding protein activator [Primorskyibacter sp. S187A]|uniref:penicillin-binding protein activator n=1 Tax=Primorskyibacter sp. S187A TaxID=3415130 RepID=UPI003C7CCD19
MGLQSKASSKRGLLKRALAGLSLIALAACEPISLGPVSVGGGGNSGQTIDTSRPVPVALLIPKSDSGAASVARSLENAARLAIADLDGVQIDLRVYDTAGDAGRAALLAQQAVNDGAKIILGPLFGEAANAAGVAVADDNVNVVAFSNNATIAGGNVFILGPTFRNTANRLANYMQRTDRDSVVILHNNGASGQLGRVAVQAASAQNGVRVDGAFGYDFSQESLSSAMAQATAAIQSAGTSTVMITDDYEGGLPLILDQLPAQGISPANTTFAGLARFDVRRDAFLLKGMENSLFAMPDQNMIGNFRARYQQAYGSSPHPLAGLGFDGIAAIGALIARGDQNALTRSGLMQSAGFQGVGGVFRFRPDGTNERGLAVATIRDQQVVILEQAPRSFSGPGF